MFMQNCPDIDFHTAVETNHNGEGHECCKRCGGVVARVGLRVRPVDGDAPTGIIVAMVGSDRARIYVGVADNASSEIEVELADFRPAPLAAAPHELEVVDA